MLFHTMHISDSNKTHNNSNLQKRQITTKTYKLENSNNNTEKHRDLIRRSQQNNGTQLVTGCFCLQSESTLLCTEWQIRRAFRRCIPSTQQLSNPTRDPWVHVRKLGIASNGTSVHRESPQLLLFLLGCPLKLGALARSTLKTCASPSSKVGSSYQI